MLALDFVVAALLINAQILYLIPQLLIVVVADAISSYTRLILMQLASYDFQ